MLSPDDSVSRAGSCVGSDAASIVTSVLGASTVALQEKFVWMNNALKAKHEFFKNEGQGWLGTDFGEVDASIGGAVMDVKIQAELLSREAAALFEQLKEKLAAKQMRKNEREVEKGLLGATKKFLGFGGSATNE